MTRMQGLVTFGGRDKRVEAISEAIALLVRNGFPEPYIYETPETLNFVPASFGYPARWFIFYDQLDYYAQKKIFA